MPAKSLFGPTVCEVPPEGPASLATHAGWHVTVPQSAEIVKPAAQLLEQLLPVMSKPTPTPTTPSGNTFVDALKKVQNQRRTENNAEAFASTESGKLIIYRFWRMLISF